MSKRVKLGSSTVAVAYIRVSTDDQKLGPEAQRASIAAWARQEGVTVASWHVDQGVSGATDIEERPGLLAALAALREYGAGVLVVAKRDRVARDVIIAALVERAATSSGAKLVSAAGEGNGDSPSDQLYRTILDGVAQHERAIIAARTKAALAAKAARGERVGQVPYGFAVADDGRTLVAVASEQTTIALAARLSAEGRSLRSVAKCLADEGRVSNTGRPFAASQIARMLG
jgi:DNA invertase Pin-like site-specific DNA recombinase